MDVARAQSVYVFGEFELDAVQRVVHSRVDGRRIKLTPRVFDTLLYLVQHAGEVVAKSELMRTVWRNVVVEEGNLTQTIHVLRRTLGEGPDEHRYIVTVPGRGYRFVAEVLPQSPDTGRPRTAGPVRAVLASLALVALAVGMYTFLGRREPPAAVAPAERPSIAVLPLADLSAAQDQRHLADGIAEEILNRLAQTRGLNVIARSSSFSFKGQDVDVATIAKRLRVTHVLEGSVRRSGNEVRVTAQLIEAANSSHVWSMNYDRPLDDLFAIQDDIAESVASALRLTLADARPGPEAGSRDARAYEEFLQGQFFYHRRAAGDIDRARFHFERALAIDPGFARAWAALAGAYVLLTDEGRLPPEIGLKKQREAAETAVRLDPRLPETHLRLAQYYCRTGDRAAADAQFETGRALDPDHPLVLGFTAGVRAREGRYDEAIRLQEQVVSHDPFGAVPRGNFGAFLLAAGRFEEAKAQLEQVLALNPALADPDLGYALILQKQYAAALERIRQWPEGEARDQAQAMIYYAIGRARDADAAMRRLQARPGITATVRVAEVFAHRGNDDEAFRWLERARELHLRDREPSPTQRGDWDGEVRLSPFLIALRDDPRWPKVVADG